MIAAWQLSRSLASGSGRRRSGWTGTMRPRTGDHLLGEYCAGRIAAFRLFGRGVLSRFRCGGTHVVACYTDSQTRVARTTDRVVGHRSVASDAPAMTPLDDLPGSRDQAQGRRMTHAWGVEYPSRDVRPDLMSG